MKHIPNLFTLVNLLFGCLAIVFILQNGISVYDTPEGAIFDLTSENLGLASLFILLAAVVDFLDGFVARLFRSTSDLGKQLDSLADVVSFGVAPGLIIYQFLRLSVAREDDGLSASMIWLIPAFFIPCAAAWRLGKFNLDATQHHSFKGVPTPAVGLLIAALPMIYLYNNNSTVYELLFNKWFLYAVIAALAYLMVSSIPIMSLKFKDFSLKNNLPKIILLIGAVVLVLLFQWLAVPFIFLLYIALSLAFKKSLA